MNKKNYHIITVRDSSDFVKTITEDLYVKEGILSTTGKLKDSPNSPQVVQEFLFDKKKWDIEDAENWVKENGDILNIMLDKSGGDKFMKPITKIYDCEIKNINEKDRTFDAVASTEAVDRDGDILRVAGWTLSNYKKNPQGLWSHASFMPPIFKTLRISKEDGALTFTPKFVPKEISPFADEIFKLYQHGFLRAFSVRFLPEKWEDIPPKQDQKPGTRRIYGKDYKKQDLLEISACTVPANPECLANKDYTDMLAKNFMVEKYNELSDEDKLKLYVGEKREGCKHCGQHKCDRAEYGCENDLNKDDAGEIIEPDGVSKPFENEHSCRLKDPKLYKTCRRTTRTSDGKKYSIITCQRKDDTTKWEEQAFRYDKKVWTVAQAKKHCTEHDGISFEPAKKSIEEGDKDAIACTKSCDTKKDRSIINISLEDISKVQPLLDILKSGRVLSAKNRKLVTDSVTQLEATTVALKALLAITEPERSADDIINNVKKEIDDEKEIEKKEVAELLDKVLKLAEENQTVLSSLGNE